MSISEQVKELRTFGAMSVFDMIEPEILRKQLNNAADTIETLSAKLQVANYEDKWIYCGDGKNMPKEHDSMFAELKGTDKWNDAMFEKISDEVNATVEYENGKRRVMTLHTIDGEWKTDRFVKFKVIAWKPLPEEYKD